MPFTRLRYHIVISTKNRQPVIGEDVEKFLYPELRRIVHNIDAHLLAGGGTDDHIHLVVAIPPKISVADFLRKVKSRSTSAIRPAISGADEFAWQKGYGCFTLNPFDMSGIYNYVRNQRRRHSRETLQQAYEYSGE